MTLRKLGQLYKSRAKGFEDYEFLLSEIENFFQYIDEIKKEYKIHSKYWANLSEFIHRIDELNQAQTRYVITYKHKEESIPSVMENERIQFSLEQSAAESKLISHLDRLKYLINLKSSLQNKDNVETRVCSICWNDLTTYFILTCGHFFCSQCIQQLEKHSTCKENIRCSVCRAICRKNALSCIDNMVNSSDKHKGYNFWFAVI